MMNLTLAPADVDANGVPLHLDQTPFTIMLQQGPGSLLMMPLCDVATRIRDPRATDAGLIKSLNTILRLAAAQPG